MLQHVLDLAAAARLKPVVVVVGPDANDIVDVCAWRDQTRLINPSPAEGIASSVLVGLRALGGSDAQRVVVLLGDQPFLTLDQLAALLRRSGSIVVPRYGGVPGNPVVLDRSVWPLAASLQGDRGFSQLFAAHAHLVTYIDVPGTNRDIDTPADLG